MTILGIRFNAFASTAPNYGAKRQALAGALSRRAFFYRLKVSISYRGDAMPFAEATPPLPLPRCPWAIEAFGLPWKDSPL
jgi:hypothetical protein